MPRFYDPQAFSENCSTPLGEAASHHALRVLRMAAGDELTLFDGRGGEWQARLLDTSGKKAQVLPLQFNADNRTPTLAVHLWLPLIKGERLDWALQKACEMGAASIQLYTSERTEVRLKAQRLDKKLGQWQQVLVAACEQCGLNLLPELHAPQPLSQLWPTSRSHLKLIAHPGEKALGAEAFSGDQATLVTGPEGGFSANELDAGQRQGFASFSLGERVLRAETAPVALLAALYTLHALNR